MNKILNQKMNKKLRSRAGETISETLVALLISALALTMLAGVIAAATRIIDRESTVLNDYYSQNEEIVKQEAEYGGRYVDISLNKAVTVTDEDGTPKQVVSDFGLDSIQVNMYENGAINSNDPVYSYKLR